ncbi:MAG TPA: sensor domain-containing diguanylate cyclase [Bacteroidota bacterium]|nr:sensor domain-containing diguanylate cyclase [Bacteroidota bacterium]
MTDARVLDTIRSWVDTMSLKQELIVLSGVILFFVGLAVPGPILKVVLFLVSGSLITYVIVGLKAKAEEEEEHELEELIQQTSHKREGEMKKLVFDDFQPVEQPYKVEVKEEAEQLRAAPSYRMPVQERREPSSVEISALVAPDEDVIPKESGPKSEFAYLLKKVLTVVKEVHFAHTAAFYWVNKGKGQIVLESYVTDSECFASHRRREIGNDLVSQVAVSGQPKLVNDVNQLAQAEILGYYESVEPVKTFVGIPIFYKQQGTQKRDPVAVLVVDSLSDDVFGPETFTLLGQFTKLISSLIQSYTDKYDLLLDSETLRSINRMREQFRMEFTLHNIVRSLGEEVSRLVAWDYIAIVLFDETRKAWALQHVVNRMNDSYVAQGQEIDPHESLVGNIIQTGIPKIIESVGDVSLPRYYRAERVDSNGSIVLLPINSVSRCYGALVIESKDLKTYSDADVKLLQKLVDTASAALETLTLTEIVSNYVLMDETTGVAARKFFLVRLQEEVQRATDFDQDMALALISVDTMTEHLNRYGKEGFDFILQNVGRMIKSSIRQYDLIGRYDFNKFAVLLINTTANEAYLWAEKLRKNIASNIINLEQKSFSVTVSAGVCGLTGGTSDMDLLDHANQVLKRAVEAGGNVVRVF